MKLDLYDGSNAVEASLGEPAYYPRFPLGPATDARDKTKRDRRADALRAFGPGSVAGLLSPAMVRTGYVPRSQVLDAILNRCLAAICLVLTAPLFAIVACALLLGTGRPVLYSGLRLGKDMRVFRMLKFRTLVPDAALQTSKDTLPSRNMLETNIGSYLRKSRLDELPQLFNILKGDMVFFGPRPTRPELIQKYEDEVPGFRIRYEVRPGLIGMSQALLPHSASKRLRGRFNAMCCRAPVRYPATFAFVVRVGIAVLRRSLVTAVHAIENARSPLNQFNFLRSGFATPKNTTVSFIVDGTETTAGVVGMSDNVIQFAAFLPPEPGKYDLEITRKLSSGRSIRVHLCAEIRAAYPVGPGKSGFICYATYAAKQGYELYRIERYLLDETVLPT